MSEPQPTDPSAGAPGSLHPVVETDPTALLTLFDRHRHVHVHGLADVAQLWDRSTWYRDADAVVSILELPGGGPLVLYAVSPAASTRTLALLAALADDLPDHFVMTGPIGLTGRLAGAFTADWHDRYLKMGLLDTTFLPRRTSRWDWWLTAWGSVSCGSARDGCGMPSFSPRRSRHERIRSGSRWARSPCPFVTRS